MDFETLKMLKDDVEIDIINNKVRIYQSIRSLVEYAVKETLRELNDVELINNNRIELFKLLNKLKEVYNIQFDIDLFCNIVITLRNIKEHEPEQISKYIDHKTVKEIVLIYNDFIKALKDLKVDLSAAFLIDEDIFCDVFNVYIDNPRVKEKFNEFKELDKFAVNRLTKKLKTLQDQLNEADYSSSYKIRSNIIATKNFIKMNDNSMLSTYIKQLKPKRKYIINDQDEFNFKIGVSDKDYGFAIYGIRSSMSCNNPYSSIYATIFNFMQRSKSLRPTTFIQKWQDQNRMNIKYNNILKYEMIILSLIKNNHLLDTIEVNLIDGKEIEFELAAMDIFNYASIIASLLKINFEKPIVKFSPTGISISLFKDSQTEIICCYDNLEEPKDSHRYMWFEPNLRYNICDKDLPLMLILLKDFFGFEQFKPGQFEALYKILNSNNSSICIMPTSAGKSLIFYFIGLLNPGSLLVVVPTNILIEDQIRNMNKYHQITDIEKISSNLNYSNYILTNKFVYLTPDAFLNFSFTDRVSQLNSDGQISNIVLDEVHCLSNWSHDFRPDYLMIAYNLGAYLKNSNIFGFTATANYKVIKDLISQLYISKDSIYEPISLKRDDIIVDFNSFDSELSMINGLKAYLKELLKIDDHDRGIVFTKTREVSERIYNSLDNDIKGNCDIFADTEKDTYDDFVNGYTKVLLTNSQLGIGINIPNVNNCYHFGFPISKNQFIQEIGRVARNSGAGNSSVLIQNTYNLKKEEQKLLDFNTNILEVISIVKNFKNDNGDIIDAYKIILGHVEEPLTCIKKILKVFEMLVNLTGRSRMFFYYSSSDHEQEKKYIQSYLIILHNVGIIDSWYNDEDNDKGFICIIDISENINNISYIKSNVINKLRNLECSVQVILSIKQCESIEEIILKYIDWYFNEFLYHHREQYINMVETIKQYVGLSAGDIIEDLTNNFNVNFQKIEDFQLQLKNQSITDLMEYNDDYGNSVYVSYVKKAIEDTYDVRYDIWLSWYEALNNIEYFQLRVKRIINKLSSEELKGFLDGSFELYDYCENNNRLFLLDKLCFLYEKDAMKLLKRIYFNKKLDKEYYIILMKIANKLLKEKKYE